MIKSFSKTSGRPKNLGSNAYETGSDGHWKVEETEKNNSANFSARNFRSVRSYEQKTNQLKEYYIRKSQSLRYKGLYTVGFTGCIGSHWGV